MFIIIRSQNIIEFLFDKLTEIYSKKLLAFDYHSLQEKRTNEQHKKTKLNAYIDVYL